MKLFFNFCVLAVMLFTAKTTIFACSCSIPSQRVVFRNSDAIFLGELSEINESKIADKDLEFYPYVTKFKIEKQWKGKKSKEILALASFDMVNMCGDLELKIGNKYLIYANKKKSYLVFNRDCSPNLNAEWKYAQKKIKNLDNFFFRTYSYMFPFPKF